MTMFLTHGGVLAFLASLLKASLPSLSLILVVQIKVIT